jgi:transcriptional regulator with XRE-family HTH domain
MLNRFRLLRLSAGLRQVDVEAKTGIPQYRISRFEINEATPTPEELCLLEEAFGIQSCEVEADGK